MIIWLSVFAGIGFLVGVLFCAANWALPKKATDDELTDRGFGFGFGLGLCCYSALLGLILSIVNGLAY